MAQEPGSPRMLGGLTEDEVKRKLEIDGFTSEKHETCVAYVARQIAEYVRKGEKKLAFDPKAAGFMHPEDTNHEGVARSLEYNFEGLDISVKDYEGVPMIRLSWEKLENLKEDPNRVAVTFAKAPDYVQGRTTLGKRVFDLLKENPPE